MPRQANLEPTVAMKIYFPLSVAARLEHRLMDPIQGKPRYAARSRLVTKLCRDWLASQPDDIAAPPLTDEELEAMGIAGNEDDHV